jgi:uncharacterized protein
VATLFEIETERVTLSWSLAHDAEAIGSQRGRLSVEPLREGAKLAVRRRGVPEGVEHDPLTVTGPVIHEEKRYTLLARAAGGGHVHIAHADPIIVKDLDRLEGGSILHGKLNFRSQIGLSRFEVLVDGEPEFSFEVEVFPTKLDYRQDYDDILSAVQGILTALALSYLRSTFQLGRRVDAVDPTDLEWIVLLRCVVGDLERALHHVAQHPVRQIAREAAHTRAPKVQRVDATLRAAIRRGKGRGPFEISSKGHRVRASLPEQRPTPTLDTPEHRWLAAQIDEIRRRLGHLRTFGVGGDGPRREKTLRDIDEMEERLAALSQLEPIAAAEGDPPRSFASLQLLRAPGYKEAYCACLTLKQGLSVQMGPLELSVREIHVLYEYWCYLETVRVVQKLTGQPLDLRGLFRIRRHGLEVTLEKGRASAVRVAAPGGRRIAIEYNPRFKHDHIVIAQKPDIVITIADPDWPPLRLVVEAKYRLDAKAEKRAGDPVPPQDAIDVLHRYRDAVLEKARGSRGPKRAVVQAVTLFPHRDKEKERFSKHRLWLSIQKIGIGAIPLLPRSSDYLEMWLGRALKRGAWSLSDDVLVHRSAEHAAKWRRAASEPALVGVLRGRDNHEREQHLAWIESERCYYQPYVPSQGRQLAAKWVAIYVPALLRGQGRGAVLHYAEVTKIEVKERGDVKTPWKPSEERGSAVVLYVLGERKARKPPIWNRGEQRVSASRWTSRLALDRAQDLDELGLETEPEWRLYEDLLAGDIEFIVKPGRAKVEDPEDPKGRSHFLCRGWKVRYLGSAGFEMRKGAGQKKERLTLDEVLSQLQSERV